MPSRAQEVLQRSCLRPKLSLRRQLLISFGGSAFLMIVLLVMLTIWGAYQEGRNVQIATTSTSQTQVLDNLHLATRNQAAHLEKMFANIDGTVQLIVEFCQDRVVGYPFDDEDAVVVDANVGLDNNGNTATDRNHDARVPFTDHDTGQQRYPLDEPPLPMDWQIDWNVVRENAREHLVEHAHQFLRPGIPASTVTASWMVQGVCDPDVVDSGDANNTAITDHYAYYPNCSEAHNFMDTGGAVQPTRTARYLHDTSGDVGVLLKPLYEAQRDAHSLLIAYMNEAAGALVLFPGTVVTGTYISIGCDWLLTTLNQYTGLPLIGTLDSDAQAALLSRCHPAGTVVSAREFNPVEQSWFRTIASAPPERNVVSHGPFNVSWIAPPSAPSGIIFGRAMYDRLTREFLGVAGVFVTEADMSSIMHRTDVDKSSKQAFLRYSSGDVFVADDSESVTPEEFRYFRDTVDYHSNWTNRDEIDQRMEQASLFSDGKVKIAYPLRRPPLVYDADYAPEFLVIQTLDEEVIFEKIGSLNSSIDQEVLELVWLSIGLGFAGVVMIFITIWVVSRILTFDLNWMDRAARQIVNHKNEEKSQHRRSRSTQSRREKIDAALQSRLAMFLNTEISRIVEEFDKMIHGFSGSGASQVAELELHEIHNRLIWHSEYHKLYDQEQREGDSPKKRRSKRVSLSQSQNSIRHFNASDLGEIPADLAFSRVPSSSHFLPAPTKCHRGRNLKERSVRKIRLKLRDLEVRKSALFWWIFLLLVIPFLTISSILCGVMIARTREMVGKWVNDAATVSVDLELDSLRELINAKTNFAESFLEERVMAAHIMARTAGWLFFDGIKRADSFTELNEGTEECKSFPRDQSCPFYDSERFFCPCDWADSLATEGACTAIGNETRIRYLQRMMFSGQARDAASVTGDRLEAASFPDLDNSPSTTLWWDDVDSIPGSQKGLNASGFSTTYDRLRVASAMAVVLMPLHNAGTALGRGDNLNLGWFLSFENDGLMALYWGCKFDNVHNALFQSSEGNLAFEVNPKLCPRGKYGYDPRCRPWYSDGIKAFRERREALHISPPYTFVRGTIGTSAVSPIVDLPSNELVGTVLHDFEATDIRRSFCDIKEGIFPFIITPAADPFGFDTVLGPGGESCTGGSKLESIGIMDAVLPNDGPETRQEFSESMLTKMRAGESGVGRFRRTAEDGQEDLFIGAYAPMKVRVLLPLRHGDFKSGVSMSLKVVYAGAVAVRENDLREPFNRIESDLQFDLSTTQSAFIAVIVLVSIAFVAFNCWITVNIVWPILFLLEALKLINGGKSERIPPMNGGSLEVQQVYITFAKLCRVVGSSNNAFFAGNIKMANHIIDDALQLYRKIGNEKAIGVACNNLANTYYATTHYSKLNGIPVEIEDSCGDLPTTLQLYDEAVNLARSDFEREHDLVQKALLSEQYSDRRFNRGLFLLLVEGDEGCPKDAKERGLNDISRVRQLDYDARGFWLEKGLVYQRSASLFSRMVRRLHGLVTFYDDTELRRVWDAHELVNDADELLFECSKDVFSSTVFDDLTVTGRIQQLESAVIRLEMWLQNYPEAARIGMRMFAEDEYHLEACFQCAAAAVLQLQQESESPLFAPAAVSSLKGDIRKMLRSSKIQSISIGKCVVLALELDQRWDLDPMLDSVNSNVLRLYDEGCAADDFVGLVAFGSEDSNGQHHRDDFTFGLGLKSENEGLHRSTLDIATTSTTSFNRPTLPVTLQMIVDSQETMDHDTYVILVTDGSNAIDSDSIVDQMEEWHEERSTWVHLIVLCMGMNKASVVSGYQALASVSPDSHVIRVDSGNVDSVFKDVIQLVSSGLNVRGVVQGISMEQF